VAKQKKHVLAPPPAPDDANGLVNPPKEKVGRGGRGGLLARRLGFLLEGEKEEELRGSLLSTGISVN
jgi:hypothetical protein